jgi:NADH-quinone oxidoreductase subunit J
MTASQFVATFLGAIVAASSVGVVAMRSPVLGALCLVVNLTAVAAMYALLGAHFLAAAQIVVYAGAIMVVVLFVIMLLNLQEEENRAIPRKAAVAGGIASILLLSLIAPILVSQFGTTDSGLPAPVGTVKATGMELYTRYVVPFEIASFLIMTGVVGAVALSRGPRQERTVGRKAGAEETRSQ